MVTRRTFINASTIGAQLDGGFSLWAQCYNPKCRRMVELDLSMLAERLGRNHSTLRKDLCPRMMCGACGGKDIGIWSSGGGKTKNGEAYGGTSQSAGTGGTNRP
ncbi:hypothetical protein J2X65_003126 [Ancylobacter sp. 3268]|uniref:hypothetical protein n=1 Tax=Ancylobacter sp. 3268 TaxID=2817752 RepID=UPI0028632ECB|nr:hypothetical protein [Ancylobacter sp. 3268]MDR6953763.1 hypothetical protein [Ancylobacter sp. 3268]